MVEAGYHPQTGARLDRLATEARLLRPAAYKTTQIVENSGIFDALGAGHMSRRCRSKSLSTGSDLKL
jgi:hypothetical protein